jgi:DNA-binding response OmpR family regulator
MEAYMKILVIDDDPAMTELLRILLEPTSAEILTANSGAEGVETARQHQPDIAILDLMMPKMNGWEVCKAIREFSSMPLLVLSAMDNPGMVATALDAGADDYLIKPAPNNVLIAHINNLIKRKRPDLNLVLAVAS